MNELVSNPFAGQMAEQSNALELAEQQRQEAEVQSALVIAKRFPRSPVDAMDRILQECARPVLAESALYAYKRGGQMVTGATIRLAETMAIGWGNMQFGMRELSSADGVSIVESFAWDLETNTRQTRVFQVPHVRYSKDHGMRRLEDPRDIYEQVANYGARRTRACILSLIPGDVIDAARRQCEQTMEQSAEVGEEQVGKLLDAFAQYGVTKAQVEDRLGHRVDSIIAAEVVGLRKIYASISQGFAEAEDFFGQTADEKGETLKERMRKKTGADAPKPEWPQQREGKWFDSRNVEFNPDYHGVDRKGRPSVAPSGHFRKRRGCDETAFATYERQQLAPKDDVTDGGTAPDHGMLGETSNQPSEPPWEDEKQVEDVAFDQLESAIYHAKTDDDVLAAEDLMNSFHGTEEQVKMLNDMIETARQAVSENDPSQ